MNRTRGGLILVPGHHDQDDVEYFAQLWKQLSQPEPQPRLPKAPFASGAIRASSLTPGSLTALSRFSIGSKRYEPGETIDCADTPSLAEALVRFGYASRMPLAALASAVGSSRLTSADLAKDRLKRALANTVTRRSPRVGR